VQARTGKAGENDGGGDDVSYCDACGRELGGTWYEGTNDAGEHEILCPSCAGEPQLPAEADPCQEEEDR